MKPFADNNETGDLTRMLEKARLRRRVGCPTKTELTPDEVLRINAHITAAARKFEGVREITVPERTQRPQGRSYS